METFGKKESSLRQDDEIEIREHVGSELNTGMSIGFDISSNLGAGSTRSLARDIEKKFGVHNLNYRAIPLDKTIDNSHYSLIAVARKSANAVYWVCLILGESGPAPLTVDAMANEIESTDGNPFTLDGILDDAEVTKVENAIEETYGDTSADFVECGNIIVLNTSEEDVSRLIVDIHSYIQPFITLENTTDLDLTKIGKQAKLKLNYSFIDKGAVTIKDNTVKADFKISLSTGYKMNTASRNRGGGIEDIISIYGYVDFEIDEVYDASARTDKLMLIPHIYTTGIETKFNTPGYAVLGIVISSAMANFDWLYRHINNIKEQVAFANLFANILNEKNPSKIDWSKINERAQVDILNQLIVWEPYISLDVEASTHMEHLVPFVEAGHTGDYSEIVETINTLSGGKFADPGLALFENGIEIPKVLYHDKTERDGRDFTLLKLMELTKSAPKALDLHDAMNSTFNEAVMAFGDINVEGRIPTTINRLGINAAALKEIYDVLKLGSYVVYEGDRVARGQKLVSKKTNKSRLNTGFFKRQEMANGNRQFGTTYTGRKYR